LHLHRPINFSASSTKDNFSTNQFHVYDLSFSSENAATLDNLTKAVGKKMSLKGYVRASPTGQSPTALHIVVTEIKIIP